MFKSKAPGPVKSMSKSTVVKVKVSNLDNGDEKGGTNDTDLEEGVVHDFYFLDEALDAIDITGYVVAHVDLLVGGVLLVTSLYRQCYSIEFFHRFSQFCGSFAPCDVFMNVMSPLIHRTGWYYCCM